MTQRKILSVCQYDFLINNKRLLRKPQEKSLRFEHSNIEESTLKKQESVHKSIGILTLWHTFAKVFNMTLRRERQVCFLFTLISDKYCRSWSDPRIITVYSLGECMLTRLWHTFFSPNRLFSASLHNVHYRRSPTRLWTIWKSKRIGIAQNITPQFRICNWKLTTIYMYIQRQ